MCLVCGILLRLNEMSNVTFRLNCETDISPEIFYFEWAWKAIGCLGPLTFIALLGDDWINHMHFP